MIIIALSIIIKPSVSFGTINIYDRINTYQKSFDIWGELIDNNRIPYQVYIIENSGYGNPFRLHPNIIYISTLIDLVDKTTNIGKSKSEAASLLFLGKLLQLKPNDKLIIFTGRYAPLSELSELYIRASKHDIIVSGVSTRFGPTDSFWFIISYNTLLKFAKDCIEYCNEGDKNFERVLYKTFINEKNKYKYNKFIQVSPTPVGGLPNIVINNI